MLKVKGKHLQHAVPFILVMQTALEHAQEKHFLYSYIDNIATKGCKNTV